MFKILVRILVLAVVALGLVSGAFLLWIQPPDYDPLELPGGKKFAFTICEDTDAGTLETDQPVMDYLTEAGLKVTKTVWVLPSDPSEHGAGSGATLSDSAWTEFVWSLQEAGHEIALHGARGGSTKRLQIIKALEMFRETIGDYPNIHINHYKNRDDVYWGVHKLDLWPLKVGYGLMRSEDQFYGHVEGSDYFWGDLLQRHVSYVVDFSYHDINTLKINPFMPHHDPNRPYVNFWFQTSDGHDVAAFNDLLAPENLDRLEKERGVCLVYTHFAAGFVKNGVLDETFKERVRDVASRDGWFCTTSELLDYLRQREQGGRDVSWRQRAYLEIKYIWEKIVYGRS